MQTANTSQEQVVSPIDALWSLYLSQSAKVRKELARRIKAMDDGVHTPQERKTLKAIDDARKGIGVTRCDTFEDYLKAVQ